MTELRRTYPAYFASKNKIALTPAIDTDKVLRRIAARYAGERVDTTDGVKIDFPGTGVHLRKSNTEPIIRVYTEGAHDGGEADALAPPRSWTRSVRSAACDDAAGCRVGVLRDRRRESAACSFSRAVRSGTRRPGRICGPENNKMEEINVFGKAEAQRRTKFGRCRGEKTSAKQALSVSRVQSGRKDSGALPIWKNDK